MFGRYNETLDGALSDIDQSEVLEQLRERVPGLVILHEPEDLRHLRK